MLTFELQQEVLLAYLFVPVRYPDTYSQEHFKLDFPIFRSDFPVSLQLHFHWLITIHEVYLFLLTLIHIYFHIL